MGVGGRKGEGGGKGGSPAVDFFFFWGVEKRCRQWGEKLKKKNPQTMITAPLEVSHTTAAGGVEEGREGKKRKTVSVFEA